VVDRLRVIRILLAVYFLGSIAIAIPLLLNVTHAGNLSGTTSGKVLAAALIAMGIGALGAARDPWRQRLMILVLIVFTSLAALAVAYRLVTERHLHDPAWLVLPFAIAAPVLLTYFYPRHELTAAGRDGGPGARARGDIDGRTSGP
jgi:MFS family permease